jgi:hypothetical protein
MQPTIRVSSIPAMVSDLEYLNFPGEGEFTKYRLEKKNDSRL